MGTRKDTQAKLSNQLGSEVELYLLDCGRTRQEQRSVPKYYVQVASQHFQDRYWGLTLPAPA